MKCFALAIVLSSFFISCPIVQAQQPLSTTRVDLKEQGSAPANPAATFWRLYVDNTGAIKVKSPAGVITTLGTLGNTVNLQSSTPGTAQTGHLNITGTMKAGTAALSSTLIIGSDAIVADSSGNIACTNLNPTGDVNATGDLISTAGNLSVNAGSGYVSGILDVGDTATIVQAIPGDPILTLKTTTTNDDPTAITLQNRIAVTDATVTTLQTFATTSDTVLTVEVLVIARRTGGSAGTAGDGASYKLWATFSNSAGTVTQIGTTNGFINESQTAWDCDFSISGTDILLRFTGAINNNVTIHMPEAKTAQVGS